MEGHNNTKQSRTSVLLPLLVVAFSVFVFTYIFLYAIDFLPTEPEADDKEEASAEVVLVKEDGDEDENDASTTTPADVAPYPTRIIIDALDIDVSVMNPQSRTVADLDAALKNGVVRHPDSADLRDNGHMFILGHSSYLPTVHNFNYRAFNGIQKLTWGDLIRVRSKDTEYVYRVTESYEVNARVGEIKLDHSTARLTLATCDSFGSVDDRFVVEAELIEETAL